MQISRSSEVELAMRARKTAEKNLAKSEEIFRLLVDAVEDYAIFALDTQGLILTWNLGAQRLKGYSAKEAIGTSFSRFYTNPDIARNHPAHELELATRNGKYEEEGWRVRKDGTRFWASVVITALRDDKGILQGFGKVTRDLTARKNAEEELKAAYANLENRIVLRTKELSEAKARAEAAVKTRDDFISMASHELKTPLTALQLQTQIRKRNLKKGDLRDFSPEKLESLCYDDERQVERLTFLVDNMLDISRLNSGTYNLIFEDFDVDIVFKEILHRMNPILQDSGNNYSYEGESMRVVWDRHRMEQVLINLLTNAVKYAPGKPVEIGIRDLIDEVEISVKDYGKGISEYDLPRIFNPFERVKDKSETAGLGLGLYISRQIVRAHRGKINVQSELGKGTTFTIRLPINGEKVEEE